MCCLANLSGKETMCVYFARDVIYGTWFDEPWTTYHHVIFKQNKLLHGRSVNREHQPMLSCDVIHTSRIPSNAGKKMNTGCSNLSSTIAKSLLTRINSFSTYHHNQINYIFSSSRLLLCIISWGQPVRVLK
jgi:hypothetical protein